MRFRQRLDAMNYMMRDQKIPTGVRRQVRDYIRKSKALVKRQSYRQLIDDSLSLSLRQKMQHFVSAGTLQHVWWLQGCEPDFIKELSEFTNRESFAHGELITCIDPDQHEERHCILLVGVASRGGSLLTKGSSFGDIVISSPILRDTRPARAIGYVEIESVPISGLHHLMPRYPNTARVLREASIRLATQRALVLMSMHVSGRARSKGAVSNGDLVPKDGSPPPTSPGLKPVPSVTLQDMKRLNFISEQEWLEVEDLSPHGQHSRAPTAAPTPAIAAARHTGRQVDSPTSTSRGGMATAVVMEKLGRLEDQMGEMIKEMKEMRREINGTRLAKPPVGKAAGNFASLFTDRAMEKLEA